MKGQRQKKKSSTNFGRGTVGNKCIKTRSFGFLR